MCQPMSSFFSRVVKTLNPAPDPEISAAFTYAEQHLPTLWLLGKTGAGKSTLIKTLTGDSQIEIGRGFKPCTQTAAQYNFPHAKPLLSFLDTKGLAEADYDAKEDIAWCAARSHALLLVVKIDETDQSQLLNALKSIQQSAKITQASLLITGIDQVTDAQEQARLISYQQQQFAPYWKELNCLAVDFVSVRKEQSVAALVEHLSQQLPVLREVFVEQVASDQEQQNFLRLKIEVLWYAAAAAATDALPALGLVAVPSIQTKLLHSLANHYGLPWSKKHLASLLGAMGSSFVLKYLSQFGIRQLVKLIPAYGQLVGGATAAAASYASTYALGRVACLYFYRQLQQEPVSREELQSLFKQALLEVVPLTKKEPDHAE